ncbi:L,D-transpeptidase [Celeribacter ethanolicus]|uniref:L,D-transpeptidase n=1 Tax=Celeribacter ethanolicus TaxID=1758178 RepID=A0A291GCI9_9RHOB|nr:L,D-transpeptidase [Celeribacter ethanolicus]ATG47858.1 L,D-transpeptidase [Celeribacter ethanolicus]TNE67017.1 MAG: L,D-transpeptidase [Paracoccaceae bacterium]
MTVMKRRSFLAAALTAPFLARAGFAEEIGLTLPEEMKTPQNARNNISSFRTIDWRDHFETLGQGAIVADTVSRALHFWDAEGGYKLYPTSVPISDELTRRGYTSVIKKVKNPTWTPTPSMRERDPSLPVTVPAGPANPLGVRALYLSWQYYRIHGTHDTRKIGRRSSDGCIGLYNEQIVDLYDRVAVGTQVKLV